MTREELMLATLQKENEELRDRVSYLESCLFELGPRYDLLGLTQSEARVFAALVKRSSLSREQITAILYSQRVDRDTPDPKIVDVFVCKIRSKLQAYDIPIETVRGQGYAVRGDVKRSVSILLASLAGEEVQAA